MIPPEMLNRNQWVVIGRKVPYNPSTITDTYREVYKHYDPTTWGTYEQCKYWVNRYLDKDKKIFDHIAYALSRDDGIICIDIDCSMEGPSELAYEIVEKFHSYTEWSIHHRGFHIYVKGHIPVDKYHSYKSHIEVCQSGWAYTMTEQPYLDVPLIENQEAIDWLLTNFIDTEKDVERIIDD